MNAPYDGADGQVCGDDGALTAANNATPLDGAAGVTAPQQEALRDKLMASTAGVSGLDFLRHVLPGPGQGYPCIVVPEATWHHYPCDTLEQAFKKAMELARSKDGFFSVGTLKKRRVWDPSKNGGKGSWAWRKHDNMAWFRCLILDLDCGVDKNNKQKDYPSQRTAVAALHAFCIKTKLPRPTTVSSGYGVHVYWTFEHAIEAAEWLELALKFKALLDAHDFKADPSRTTDLSSVLRLVETINRKDPKNPKPVEVRGGLQPHTPVAKLRERIEAALREAPTPVSAGGSFFQKLQAQPILASAERLPPPAKTPENIAIVERMLACLPPDMSGDRTLWMRVVWAVLDTRWGDIAVRLAREWSERGKLFDPTDFPKVVASFDPTRTSFGTLVTLARDHGYDGPRPGQAGAGTNEAVLAGGDAGAADDGTDLAHLRGPSDDTWNGRRFARQWRGRLRYIPEQDERSGYWLVFDPACGWRVADFGEVERAAIAIVEMMVGEVSRLVALHGGNAEHPDVKRLSAQLKYSRKGMALRELIRVAKALPGMSARESDFDSNPMHLGVANGVLNLNTGTLLPVTPDVMVRLRCNVAFDPAATCSTFERFLARMQPDPEQRAFLRRWLFYCLTGRFGEKKFLFHYGPDGNNGKSTLLEVFASMVGDHARKIATESLMEHKRNAQSHDADLAVIRNKRFLFASETRPGQRLSSDRIKDLTGGDTVVARRPHEKEALQLRPTFKLNMYGNHLPVIDDPSRAMWSRVLVLEWNVVISGTDDDFDPDLRAKLLAEAPGLLNWVLGVRAEYLAGGLATPVAVLAAAESYRKEENTIAAFVADRCRVGDGLSVEKDRLYEAYADWWKGQGHTSEPGTNKLFTRRIGKEGYPLLPDKRRMGGLCLASSPSTLGSVSPLRAA